MVQFMTDRVIVVCLFILFYITENKSAPYMKSDYLKYDKSGLFGKLLHSVANLNEDMMEALKRYTELDSYNVASRLLRSDESKQNPLVTIVMLNEYTPQTTDGILENNFSFLTPRKPHSTVEDIFDILLFKGNNFDFDANEEAKRYLQGLAVENLTYKEMRKNLGINNRNDIGLILEPISTSTNPIASPKNNGDEFDTEKIMIEKNGHQSDLRALLLAF